ncbi:MAG: hypothetical protein CMJ46_10430 [Planctomyces sp.]|nr:hypothetical protein [Planctomyces sp.]
MKYPTCCLALLLLFVLTTVTLAEDIGFRFEQSENSVTILHNEVAIASYVFDDPEITRPYLAHVKTVSGIQITRNHPPQPDDPQDHANFHPGIFLAFGDINGNDYWRLKSKVKHAGFVEPPNSKTGAFTVENHYLDQDGSKAICVEKCRYQFVENGGGYLILMQSEFHSSENEFYFGDQEEMGLGARLATPLREKNGTGRILNSEGQETAALTWGQEAKWVDYSGEIKDHHVGIMMMTHPSNARPSWWHNRDYGLFAANLFGRKAMKQGEISKITVQPGEIFKLGFGVYVHEGDPSVNDLQVTYKRYVKLSN